MRSLSPVLVLSVLLVSGCHHKHDGPQPPVSGTTGAATAPATTPPPTNPVFTQPITPGSDLPPAGIMKGK